MTIVRNYSDLSPVMRDTLLIGEADTPRTALQVTGDALQCRGLVDGIGNNWYRLTDAGKRARAALEKAATIPLKIQPWLDKAESLGLEVHESERSGSLRSWTIGTPNPIDNTQVWIYFTDSPRGGRVGFTVYHGSSVRPTRKATRRFASIAMNDMGESLQRHLAREAAKDAAEEAELAALDPSNPAPPGWDLDTARSALGQVFAELDGAVIPNDDETQRAEAAGLTVSQLRERVDPARPGWFMVGQIIFDNIAKTYHQVTAVELGSDGKVARVAVTLNGGHGGKWYWFGDHPDATADLGMLEFSVGLDDDRRRPWPKGLRAAHEAVRLVLIDQVLSGWVAGQVYETPEQGYYLVVNVPDGTDPTRHLELLRRYVPYRNTIVELSSSAQYDRYPTIVIRARED
jgi:hypothetical protein